jgi:predicted TIM-barrel fold metal-dependent hydrolase
LKTIPEIWDAHSHLAGVPGDTPEARLGRLLEYADRLGIARLCVCMGLKWNYDPSPATMRQENDEVLRAIRAFPDRAFGFVYLNPKHTRASLDELNRCVRDGPMVGVKLWVAQRCNAPELDPLVARAAELQAIILQHTWLKITGNLPGESTPRDLAELAARHPQATFLCGHTGGDWETGLRAIRPWKNVYADLCGGDPVAGYTEMAVRELGAERVLYGSDAGGRSFASQLAKVFGADVPEPAKRLILGGNLKRLLRPILNAKGVGT